MYSLLEPRSLRGQAGAAGQAGAEGDNVPGQVYPLNPTTELSQNWRGQAYPESLEPHWNEPHGQWVTGSVPASCGEGASSGTVQLKR